MPYFISVVHRGGHFNEVGSLTARGRGPGLKRRSAEVNWTAGDVRGLRGRLGWCQAEMARQLKCDVELIRKYEQGETRPDDGHRHRLSSIFHQAEQAAAQTLRRPMAEIMMRDRGISQIHDLDVLESWPPEIELVPRT